MLAGMFRFVCCNGLVVGEVVEDIRIPHKGDIHGEVIEGAFRVLEEFETVEEHTDGMKALQLEPPEEIAFATAALALRFGERTVMESGGHRPAPVTATGFGSRMENLVTFRPLPAPARPSRYRVPPNRTVGNGRTDP